MGKVDYLKCQFIATGQVGVPSCWRRRPILGIRANAFTLLYRVNITILEIYIERGLSPSLALSAFVSSTERESRSSSTTDSTVGL